MRREHPTFGGRGALAAARTALRADLGWLRGFPTAGAQDGAVPWRVVPALDARSPVTDEVVDADRLRRATFALRTLPERFPRALPRLVGDVDRWAARSRALLAALDGSIRGA